MTYGKQPGSEAGYRQISDLDERLSRHVAPPAGSASAARRRRKLGAAEMSGESRWRNARWMALGLIAIGAVATLSALLTSPTPGGLMDPDATSSAGAHAL